VLALIWHFLSCLYIYSMFSSMCIQRVINIIIMKLAVYEMKLQNVCVLGHAEEPGFFPDDGNSSYFRNFSLQSKQYHSVSLIHHVHTHTHNMQHTCYTHDMILVCKLYVLVCTCIFTCTIRFQIWSDCRKWNRSWNIKHVDGCFVRYF